MRLNCIFLDNNDADGNLGSSLLFSSRLHKNIVKGATQKKSMKTSCESLILLVWKYKMTTLVNSILEYTSIYLKII
jgi:hypothetical protein